MFANLFNMLSSLSNSTKLLEACEWSEERAQNLVLFCASAMEEIKESDRNISTMSELENALSDYLISTHTQSEINILMEVIRDEMTDPKTKNIGEC